MKDYPNNFMGHQIPNELIELQKFDREVSEEYSVGFELGDLSEKAMLKSCSEEPEFLASLIEFANASHSGSIYAFWIANVKDLTRSPIVIFGDEGGSHVVAENIRQLLVILSYDVEPLVSWKKVEYHGDDTQVASPGKNKFREWLKTFQLTPIEEPNSIVDNAQRIYKNQFAAWMKTYVK